MSPGRGSVRPSPGSEEALVDFRAGEVYNPVTRD